MTAANSTPHGRVYLITNSANGKQYVGQTTQPIQTRFRQHCALQAKCRALEAAIRKYGAECFSIAELAAAGSQDELNALEAHYVAEFATVAPGGYNLREGGGAKGAMHPETKKLMRSLGRRPEVLAQLTALNKSPRRRAESREQGKKNWPKVATRMEAARMNPDAQKRRIASVRAAWADPELMERQRTHLAEIAQRPEVKAKRSAALKARWAAMTAEQRAEEGRKISDALKGHKKNIDYSPEAITRRKQVAAKRWDDPEYRATMLRANSDPEVVKKRGDAIRA